MYWNRQIGSEGLGFAFHLRTDLSRWLTFPFHSTPAKIRNRGRQASLGPFMPCAEILEGRVLLSAAAVVGPSQESMIATPSQTALAASVNVPALSTLPGAEAILFLNFAGDTIPSWGGVENIVIPPWDTDDDPSSFSTSELEQIEFMWRFVAEDFAPFKINVTTVNPQSSGEPPPVHITKINIGGDGAWYSDQLGGGVAELGTFSSSSLANPALGFVFDSGNSDTIFMANVISHESGHTFGLEHQRKWIDGQLTGNDGPNFLSGPLVGGATGFHSQWWYGTSELGPASIQDDFAVIAANDHVGLRTDDAGDNIATAIPLTSPDASFTVDGLVGTEADVDYWSFTAVAGRIVLNVDTHGYQGNLSATVRIVGPGGEVLASSSDLKAGNAQKQDHATVSYVTSTPGTYFAVVASSGLEDGCTADNHGFNVGTYRLTATSAPYTATHVVGVPPTIRSRPGKVVSIAADAALAGTDVGTQLWSEVTVAASDRPQSGDIYGIRPSGKANDRISVKANSLLRLGKRQIGTVSQSASGITISFYVGQKTAFVEQLLRQLTFKSRAPAMPSRELLISLKDESLFTITTQAIHIGLP